MSQVNYFIPLIKANAESREIWGIAAIEEPDVFREIMDYELSKPNFVAWSERMSQATGGKNLGNVRYMHKGALHVAGKLIHFEPLDNQKAFYVGVKVTEDDAWNNVQEGIYTGFSVGGKYGKRFPDPLLKGHTRYEAIPLELSLVDVPAMPDARFELVKMGGESELRKFAHELKKGDSLDELPLNVRSARYDRYAASDPESAPYILKKGMNMDKTEEILSQMESSESEDVKALAAQLRAALSEGKPAEAEAEAEGEQPASQQQEPMQEEHETETESEAGAAPEGQGLSADGVKEIVINLLAELGLVQKQEDVAKYAGSSLMTDIGGELSKGLSALDQKIVEKLNAAVEPLQILQKSFTGLQSEVGELKSALTTRQGDILGDLAKVASAAEDLHTRLGELEKRGGMGPVLREIGSISPQALADGQQIEVLKQMASATNDPMLRQKYQAEITRLGIKAVHS
jgi:hypothetical protein